MNDTEKYIVESIKTWVWSGFYTRDEGCRIDNLVITIRSRTTATLDAGEFE